MSLTPAELARIGTLTHIGNGILLASGRGHLVPLRHVPCSDEGAEPQIASTPQAKLSGGDLRMRVTGYLKHLDEDVFKADLVLAAKRFDRITAGLASLSGRLRSSFGSAVVAATAAGPALRVTAFGFEVANAYQEDFPSIKVDVLMLGDDLVTGIHRFSAANETEVTQFLIDAADAQKRRSDLKFRLVTQGGVAIFDATTVAALALMRIDPSNLMRNLDVRIYNSLARTRNATARFAWRDGVVAVDAEVFGKWRLRGLKLILFNQRLPDTALNSTSGLPLGKLVHIDGFEPENVIADVANAATDVVITLEPLLMMLDTKGQFSRLP